LELNKSKAALLVEWVVSIKMLVTWWARGLMLRFTPALAQRAVRYRNKLPVLLAPQPWRQIGCNPHATVLAPRFLFRIDIIE
jgi:hypothetical protein